MLAIAMCLAAFCGQADAARPALELQRDVTRAFVRAGSSTTLVYRVENTGTVTLENVRVTDPLCGAVSGPETLEPGEYRVYTVTVAITGECKSAPTASWQWADMSYEKTLESVSIRLAEDSLGVSIQADAGEAPEGGLVTIRALLKNDGNAPLRDIALDDETLGGVGSLAEALEPGAQAEYTYSAKLSESATFRLIATARSASGETVSASSNGVTVLLDPENGGSLLSLRASAAQEAVAAPGPVDVTITLVNSGGGDLGGVAVSELRSGALRTLAALGPGETTFVCSCPVPETGEMQFLAEYSDAPGSTAIVFSAPVRVELRPGGTRAASRAGDDPLELLGAPHRLSQSHSAYGVFVYGMLIAFAALLLALVTRGVYRFRRRRRKREKRMRRMRVLRRNARMDEAEWVRTRPHKPVSP